MQWSDIPFRPTTRTLRQFAVLWLVFFGGLAIWEYATKELGQRDGFGCIGPDVGPVGLIAPRLLCVLRSMSAG